MELEPTPEVLAKRKHPKALCETCPFYESKDAFVGSWNVVPEGKLLILGAAPGVHEARKGIPFTGPSGELTDQVLQHHGISRSQVMLSNVVLCKPEGQDSDPPKAAIDACRPRLIQEIAESGVELIVSLGKVAMGETINDRGSMRKIRVGPPKPYKYDANVGVIATWHTAYALRSPDSFPDIVFDFGKIRGKVEHDWSEPDYRVFDDPVLATRALKELRSRFDRVVIDIETGVEKDNSFDHPSEYDLLCVGIAFAKGKAVVIGETALQDDGVRAGLRDLLSSTKIIAHNGKFDLAGLRNVCGRQTLWFDTMLASNCLAPGTRTLRSDLTWCNIEDLKPGDELVGFSEHFTSEMKPTKVIATKRQIAKTYRIKTSKGEIVASAGHLWPVRRPDGEHTKIEWRTTQQLFVQRSLGWRLMHFVDPWEVDRSYEGGYLAGFLDGEGNYAGGGLDNANGSKRIQFTQNPGDTLGGVLSLLRARGFSPKLNGRPGRYAEQWELSNRQAIRLIGSVRPVRFMPKAHELWQGNRRCKPIDIISIEYVGEQEVIGLETSTKTFVAEGFLTHNCLDERPGHHGLKQLSIERLGAPEYEADIHIYVPKGGNYANIPRDVLYKYNAYDVVCTWDLYEMFSKEFTEMDWQKHDFIVEAANAIIELELNGIHFDVEYNEKLSHEYQTILADIEAKMDELVGYVVNPRSPKQLTDYYATHHLQLPSTNADLLKELRDNLDGEVLEFTDLLLEHRRKAKLYGCVDEETEILTQRGWLRFDEVRSGDVTLSINEHSGFAEWDEIEGVHLYPGQHELVSWEGRDFSALTTHDHRWLVDNNGSFGSRPGLKWKTTDTVAHGDRVPKAVLCSTLPTQPKYSDAFVELVGWIWTEGSKDMTGLNIVQSHTKNLSNVERIRRALVEICPNPIKGVAYNAHNPYWSERKANDSITEFYLNAALSEEFFDVFVTHKVVEPTFITSLTYSQLKLFVEVSMLGDGHATNKGQGNSHLAQSRKEQLFAFQLACTLLGIPTSELRKDKDYYGIYMHKGKYHHPRLVEWRNGGRKLVKYDGTVWCVTTTNQNWLARRNGKVYYTGNTYVKGLAKRVTSEGKVYTTYTLHGTTSGRLASRQPNLQNIVREKSIRNQFIVENEDNRFIQCDYKQVEGRVITTLARDEYLREIFADSDRDLFSELCNDIFGHGMWEKEQRVAMKSIFYGNAYGRGVKSIAKELQMQGSSITEIETSTLMREFNNLIPSVMEWQKSIKQFVLSGNDLVTPFGRKRSFWLITDKNRSDVLNEALSYMPQSIASDICLRALIRLTPMLEGLATPRLSIHDAIVVETHKDKVDETIDLMRREMVKSAVEFSTYLPFEVDATIGTKWGDL